MAWGGCTTWICVSRSTYGCSKKNPDGYALSNKKVQEANAVLAAVIFLCLVGLFSGKLFIMRMQRGMF